MIIIHGTSQKTNGWQLSSGPRNQCLRFRFSHRERPKTRTTRTLSNSSKKPLISTFPSSSFTGCHGKLMVCNFLQVREINVRVLGFGIGKNLKCGHRGHYLILRKKMLISTFPSSSFTGSHGKLMLCNFLQVREINVRVLGFGIGKNIKRGHRGHV